MPTNSTTQTILTEPEIYQPDIFAPDVGMMLLTWLTFFGLFAILYKMAFKPILQLLQQREDYIRSSLEQADQIKESLAVIDQQKKELLDQARKEATTIIHQARISARKLADSIEEQAKKHAEDIIKSANAQVQGERQRVTNELKVETVNIAISLAEKVLHKNLNTQANRELIETAIKEDMR